MRNKVAKKLRKIAKLMKPVANFYSQESKPASWGFLPYLKDKDGTSTGKLDTKVLHKLKEKTPDYKIKTFGSTDFFRFAKGQTQVLGHCTRQLYQDSKKEFYSKG